MQIYHAPASARSQTITHLLYEAGPHDRRQGPTGNLPKGLTVAILGTRAAGQAAAGHEGPVSTGKSDAIPLGTWPPLATPETAAIGAVHSLRGGTRDARGRH